MFRTMIAMLAAGFFLVATQPTHAEDARHRCRLDAQRVRCWPEPFIRADRAGARSPFAVMVQNGWRARTTLGNPHFDPKTQQLNHAGLAQVRWILTEVPPQYRTVFVQTRRQPNATAKRLQAVQVAANAIIPKNNLPIVATIVAPPQRSAHYIVVVNKKAEDAVKPPVLPPLVQAGAN